MRFTTTAFLSILVTAVSAHFQLQYPPPRGVFVEDDEPTFCDGYTSVNRTTFPLTKGKLSLNSEHPSWTLGGILATVSDPTSFNNFKDSSGNFQMAVPFFETNGEGLFCIDLDLESAGISGVSDGANVTLQLVFDGGDGQLYQCADLSLSSTATVPSDITCKNASSFAITPVSTVVDATSTGSATATGTSSTTSATSTSAAQRNVAAGASGMAAILGAVVAFL